MKLVSKIVVASSIFIISIALGYATSARCAYCPSSVCYGTCATPDCVCITAPGEVGGSCWGASYSEKFKSMGWSVE